MNEKPVRCALYPRVSTEEQFINGLSLDAQRADLQSYADRMGYAVVGIYADEGISARKPVSKRPALLQLLEDVKQNKIDIILVTKLDRWFRNIKEYQITEEILQSHNCHWKTIYEDYDTSTANGQMIVNIMLAVNQNECDRTSERIKAVFRHKVAKGEHLTGAAPYGYITADKKLQKDPVTRPIVEEIFSCYFSCFSKRKTILHILSKYQDHENRPTEYQINRILSHELYAGIYNGQCHYHPAYITEDQYRTIQAHCDSKSYPHTNEAYIFSGLIRCPSCGVCMTGFVKKQKLKDGSYSHYKRYRCYKKYPRHQSGACVTEHIAEEYLLEHLCPELNNQIYNLKQKAARHSLGPNNQSAKYKAELERLNILFQKGRISDSYYEEQYGILETKLQSVKSSVDLVPVIAKFENIQSEFSGNWKELYEQLDASHKNAFWKRIIREIYIDENTHKICGFSFV